MFIQYNANPVNARVGDCVIRAVSKALNQTWEETYIGMLIQGYIMFDMPSANHVWGAYLRHKGFIREEIPNTCPDCYTIKDFCKDHPEGSFVVAVEGHVIAVENGNHYDTWNSENEIPLYYFVKGR